jgi:cell wall-associated NlpC family hydrolase
MTNREAFLKAALGKIRMPYLWDGKLLPQEPQGVDCSGLITASLFEAGGPDLRADWNTQRMFDDWPSPMMLVGPAVLPGDLVLYGNQATGKVWHVMIALGIGELVFGAAGGDHTTTTIEIAEKIGASVQLWVSKDAMVGFVGYRRIPWVNQ